MCVPDTRCGRGLYRTFKIVLMKKVVLSFFVAAVAFVSFGQDASQPQGTWYLGTADATEVLNLFSTGVQISPTIGYAVADNIVVSVSLASYTLTDTYGSDVIEESTTSLGLSGAYFLEGNYYLGAAVSMSSSTLTNTPDVSGFGFGVEAGKFIPIRENWYINPNLSYGSTEVDFGGDVNPNTVGDSQLGLSIGFGARF